MASLIAIACLLGAACHVGVATARQSYQQVFVDDDADVAAFEGRYYFHDVALSWLDAAQYCRGNDSHLAFPDTVEEAVLLAAMMDPYDVTHVHIGLHDLFGEGRYSTILGELVADACYAPWVPGFPVGGAANNCGGFEAGAGLFDQPCTAPLKFICEKAAWWDYKVIDGLGLYKYHDKYLPWGAAVAACEAEDAHLLVVSSEEEYAALLDEFSFTWLWVGANHILEDREFVTIFDTSLSSTNFSRWAQGEPSGSHKQYPWVALAGADGLYILSDEAAYICKRPL